MSNGRYFVRHLRICNRICVKLLKIMSGVILHNLKKTTSLSQTVFLRSTNVAHTHTDRHTHTRRHTHTHVDSIMRNAMRCISPKNVQYYCLDCSAKTKKYLPAPRPSCPMTTLLIPVISTTSNSKRSAF